MPTVDQLGNTTVTNSDDPQGTFPQPLEYGFSTTFKATVRTFQFPGTGDNKREQRYYEGHPIRHFSATMEVTDDEADAIYQFYEQHFGSLIPFFLKVPIGQNTLETLVAYFENEPVETQYGIAGLHHVTCTFCELPDGTTPQFNHKGDIVTRFPGLPGDVLYDGLASQTQRFIRMVRIKPKVQTVNSDGTITPYPTIFLSDMRCQIDGDNYVPRVLSWDGIGQVACGMPNVGTESDNVQITLGNSDDAIRFLAEDVMLDHAIVECLAYHINTDTLLELWAGEIVNGGWVDNGTGQFQIQCSDPISSPFLMLPVRTIARYCNKTYALEPECPFARVGNLDTVNYPDADASFCDKGYTTDNGCMAHGMELYYAGLNLQPQSVRTKDNSTGLLGFGRQTLVTASLIADSAYGQVIPIIVTDTEMPVQAILIDGRDEGDFYEGLGIVGEGPLSMPLVGHTLDGQFNHGYPGPLGIFINPGTDPQDRQHPLSLDDTSVGFEDPNNFSAGTASVTIRIKDASGLQLTTLDQHSMEVLVDAGWKGYVWTGDIDPVTGIATNVASVANPTDPSGLWILTNPVWLAVNCFLLAKGLYNAPTADQEAVLDIPKLVAAAYICDLVVDRVVESEEGQETQYKFIGVISNQKSLRDWLSDILLNCLGFYSFNFGKFACGIRENASAISAYTDGNIIKDSIKLSAMGSQFTKLTSTFADAEYGFLSNTSVYADDDFALQLGGGVRLQHLPGTLTLSGTADISPATRITVTRGREESGGVDYSERFVARRITFRTTMLGLDTFPGAVVSITSAKVPGGLMHFRIERWQLQNDWSIVLTGRYVTASMYDLVQGPKPADVRPDRIPNAGEVKNPCWMPNNLTPPVGDPIYDVNDHFFEINQLGRPSDASLAIFGDDPVNSPAYPNRPLIGELVPSGTGGNLINGVYSIVIATQQDVIDSFGDLVQRPSLPCKIATVTLDDPANTNIGGVGSGSINIKDIVWPLSVAGAWDRLIVYASANGPERLCAQFTIESPDPLAMPTEILFTGDNPVNPAITPVVKWATYGQPDTNVALIRQKIKQMAHPGVVVGIVTTVSADGTQFTCMHLAADRTQDTNTTEGSIIWDPDPDLLAIDDWTTRICRIITERTTGSCPIKNVNVTGYDPTSGTFTCDPGVGTDTTTDPPQLNIGPGDIFILGFQPQWTPDFTGFEDLGMFNGEFPFGTDAGNPANGVQGRIIAGPGRGQVQLVTAHDNTTYTFAAPFVGVTKDSTIIIEFVDWLPPTADGPVLNISDYLTADDVNASLLGFLRYGLLVQAVLVNFDGSESPDVTSAVRECYTFPDVSYGVGGDLTLQWVIEFGRGSDQGPAEVAAGAVSSIFEVEEEGFLQAYSIVNEGMPVGDSTFDIQKYDPVADVYNSILLSPITIPDSTHDKVLYSTAFALGMDTLKMAKGDLLKCVCLTTGAPAPMSPIIKVYWGAPLDLNSGGTRKAGA